MNTDGPDPDDALAVLRDGVWHDHQADRPERYTIDSAGWPITLEVPSPRTLARLWARPSLSSDRQWYRTGSAGLAARPLGSEDAPTPADFARVVDELHARLAALPERADARRPYCDLRMLVAEGDRSTVGGYLERTLREMRKTCPMDKPPAVKREYRSPAQRMADVRARRQADMCKLVAEWLPVWLAEAAPGRYSASELYDLAAEAIEEYQWDADEPLIPTRQAFNAVVSTTLRRSASRGQDFYIVEESPEQHISAVEWCLTWREHAAPGTHSAHAVYTEYTAKEAAPIAARKFNELADHPEVLGPRKRLASGQARLRSQEVQQMTREQKRALAEEIVTRLTEQWNTAALDGLADMLTDRAANVAETVSGGNVVSLDARRRAA